MSVHVTTLVWKAQRISCNQKLVLLKLADCADDDGRNVYPSVQRIARECCLSERTVQRFLRRFVDLGLLSIEANGFGGRGRARLYRMHLRTLTALGRQPARDAGSNGVDDDPEMPTTTTERVTGCHPSPAKRVTPATVKGDTDDAKGCQALSPYPSKNRQEPGARTHVRTQARAPARERPPPANAVWREHHDAIVQAVGRQAYRTWLQLLIPERDDGRTLALAGPTRFICDWVRDNYADRVAGILNRKIELVPRQWAQNAYQANQRRERQGLAAAHA